MKDTLDDYIHHARVAAEIEARVSIDPQRIVVCRHPNGSFRMYAEDAWAPAPGGILPWAPPPENLVKVCAVSKEGTVEFYPGQEPS